MRRNRTYFLGAGASALACLAPMGTLHAEPLATRNQHPLVALYGLPLPLPARLPGSARIGAHVNWSNFSTTDTTDRGSYTLDGEVFELRLQAQRAIREDFVVRGELAWRQLSGGSLDSLVENWHDLFGLPGGSRNRLPRDQLLIEARAGESTLLQVTDDAAGLADIPLAFGYQLDSSERGAAAAWLTIKLPTGKADDLTGSGAVDVALSLAGERQLSDRWLVFGQANAVWLGKGDVLAAAQQDYSGALLAGTTWRAWPRFELTVQLEANSAVLDTGTALDGDAIVLSLGGRYRTPAGWSFEFGLSEDLQVAASPDVVFLLGVRR